MAVLEVEVAMVVHLVVFPFGWSQRAWEVAEAGCWDRKMAVDDDVMRSVSRESAWVWMTLRFSSLAMPGVECF